MARFRILVLDGGGMKGSCSAQSWGAQEDDPRWR